MNILFFHKKIHPFKGGIGRVTCTLASFFSQKGHKVFYFLAEDSGFFLENAHIATSGNFACNGTTSEEFRLFLRENRIDVVINQTIDYATCDLVLLCKLEGASLITVCHTSPLTSVKYFHVAMKERFLAKKMGWLLPLFSLSWMNSCLRLVYRCKYRRLFKKLYSGSDKFFLLSDKFLSELAYILGEDCDDRVCAMPNPIPSNSFIYEGLEKDKTLLYVGSVNFAAKQTNLLLSIWEKLFADFPDWRLIIVGGGAGLVRAQALAKQKSLERVFFEGYQNPLPYYKSAAIFCLTSSHEGFSMSVVEASATQCVPFAFGSYEAVKDVISSGGGEIIKAFDCEEYAEKLRWYMRNPEQRRLAGKAAQSHVEMFLVDKIGSRWEKILSELLEARRKRPLN